MNLVGVIVILATVWFLVFYIVLQLRTRTQAEEGHVVPGTPPSAPAFENVGQSALITTPIALVISAIIIGLIMSGWFSFHSIDIMGVLDEMDEY